MHFVFVHKFIRTRRKVCSSYFLLCELRVRRLEQLEKVDGEVFSLLRE